MVDVLESVGKGVKFLGVVVVSFGEAVTVSFYHNVQKRYKTDKPVREHYYRVKVPAGYKSAADEPEYRDLTESALSPPTTTDTDNFLGLPGFK